MISNFTSTAAALALLLTGSAATVFHGALQDAPAPGPKTTKAPAASPEDVESLDAIIGALYDVISGEQIGPDGENQRDWARFRSLYHPELGRLIPLRANLQDPEKPQWKATGMKPDDYVGQGQKWMRTTAFYETEIHRVEERFGGIAHVWSTYEGRNAKDAETPFLRGVNSIQAMFDGDRWWILVVAWDAERPDQPLPAKYLPSK